MTPEQFAELDRLFHRALELPSRERDKMLRRVRERSPDIARRLSSMLGADASVEESISDVVSRAASDLTAEADRLIGERFGAYRVERLIGRGGMGAVYLGRRVEGDFEQTAAIKTVRYGLDSPQLLERFRREREILAQLNHPGIAGLLDGGSGPGGLPFVAMEFVDGVPITEYARSHDCGLRLRLELFAELCDAIDFVHRHSVVHRDIKPGNVLVTPEGRIKLLDFGIAKLTDALEFEGLTRTEQRPMTPEYASPEQVLNRPITTATDVYSLGVLLYELTTDTRPIRIDSNDPYAISRIIVEQDPLPPSATKPAPSWRRRLRGDLDRIVMMAMRKEPERRYASAGALGEDVRRYLDGRPVAAQDDTWHYRARKFVTRHPAASAVAAVLLVSLLAFGAVTLAQNERIRAQRDRAVEAESRAQATSDFLTRLLMTADPRQAGNRTMTVVDVVKAGIDELDRAEDLDPASRIELHMVLGFALTNLDDYEPGVRSMERAVELSRIHFGADSLRTAEVEHRLGDMYRRVARFDEAYALLTRALEIRKREIDGPSHEIADSYNNLAILTIAMGRYQESHRLQTASIRMHAEAGGETSGALLTPLNNLALLEQRRGRYEEALALSRRARNLGDGSDQGTYAYIDLTVGRTLMEMGRLDEAERMLRHVRPRYLQLVGPRHTRVITIDRYLADILRMRGHYEEAGAALARLETLTLEAKGPRSTQYAHLLLSRGILEREQLRLEDSERTLRHAAEIHRDAVGPRHFNQPRFEIELARTLDERGRTDEAMSQLREALAALPDPDDYPHIVRAEALVELARALRATGEPEAARDALDTAASIVERTTGAGSSTDERIRLEREALLDAG